MEGDDVLLAETEKPKVRDEWMTKLPPERKVRNENLNPKTKNPSKKCNI